MIRRMAAAAALILVAGCASAPQPGDQVSQPLQGRPACQAGTSARGLAAGFFAFFQDRPECF